MDNMDQTAPAQLETKKLFVRNLDWTLTEEQVHAYFSQFGEIASVKLPLDKFGRKRGFGFVEYMNEEDAQKALAEANEKTIAPSERLINVSFAEQRKPFAPRSYGHGGDRGDRGDRGHYNNHHSDNGDNESA